MRMASKNLLTVLVLAGLAMSMVFASVSPSDAEDSKIKIVMDYSETSPVAGDDIYLNVVLINQSDSDVMLTSVKALVADKINYTEPNLPISVGKSKMVPLSLHFTADMNIVPDDTNEITLAFWFTDMNGEMFSEISVEEVKIESPYVSENRFNKFFGILDNPLPEPLNSPAFTAIVSAILVLSAIAAAGILSVKYVFSPLSARDSRHDAEMNAVKIIVAGIAVSYAVYLAATIINNANLTVKCYTMTKTCIMTFVLSAFMIAYRSVAIRITENKIDKSYRSLLLMICDLIIMTVFVYELLIILRLDSMLAAMSSIAFGLIVGVGAKNMMDNVITGFVLRANRTLNVDDIISLDRSDERYCVKNLSFSGVVLENIENGDRVFMNYPVVAKAPLIKHR